MNDHSPQFLVGHAPLNSVTDTAPIRDFDTGYRPEPGHALHATGAWLEGDDPEERQFINIGPLELELGTRLADVRIAYETWGELNDDATNAVLLCHALTGDSHATSLDGTTGWWNEIVGPGKAIDTNRWFVVCPNVLGGCQGTTGPASDAPDGEPWGSRFPSITIRDMVNAEAKLADLLGIDTWALVAGASFGGNVVMEWGASYPDRVRSIAVLVSGAAATAEQIAWSHMQISAIELDANFLGGDYYGQPDGSGPHRGLGLAREIAHTTYRYSGELDSRFGRLPQAGENPLRGGRYAIESYLQHHGRKLALRFDANSYIHLTRTMMTHDIGRARGGTDAVLATMHMPALVVAVDSDRLFYPDDVAQLADKLPGCRGVVTVNSGHGHDGFLVENDQVTAILRGFVDDPELDLGA